MGYEWRLFIQLGTLNKQQFKTYLAAWLNQNKLKKKQLEKRKDLYIIYPDLSPEYRRQFGLKFRNIKFKLSSPNTVNKLKDLELKVCIQQEKDKAENWVKIVQDKIESQINLNLALKESKLSQFQLKTFSSEQKDEPGSQ